MNTSITIKGTDCRPQLFRYVSRRNIDIGLYADLSITTKRQGNFTIVAVVVGERMGLGTSKRTTSDNEYQDVGETIALWRALDDLYVSPFTGE